MASKLIHPIHAKFLHAPSAISSATANDHSTTSITPISRLGADVLWNLFDIIASEIPYDSLPVQERPLTTICHCFSVCWDWRNIVEYAPSVWGKVIDLDVLSKMSEPCREAVLMRTGHALLQIVGICNYDRKVCLTILERYWERVRWVSLNIHSTEFQRGDQRLAVIQRRAPELQHFALRCTESVAYIDAAVYPSSSLEFSGDTAPKLKTLASVLNIIPKSLKGTHIVILILDFVVSFSALFTSLGQLPHLQELHLFLKVIPLPTNVLPFVQLLNLFQLSLRGSFEGCLLVMEHITPKPGCNLWWTHCINREQFLIEQEGYVTENDQRAASHQISRYFQNYLSQQASMIITIVIISRRAGHPKFFFQTRTSCQTPDFYVDFEFTYPQIYESLFSRISESSGLSRIAKLTLEIDDDLGPCKEVLRSFAKKVPSLELLRTTYSSLQCLPFASEGSIAITKLRVIDFAQCDEPVEPEEFIKYIKGMLIKRRNAGFGIQFLDISSIENITSAHIDLLNDLYSEVATLSRIIVQKKVLSRAS